MPDELVVCFTLNQQSMKGAAAAAESAWTQRLKPSGEPGLRVWPVPTRIELAELVLHGWGAFTVGATCDDGATSLELDLAGIETLPEKFRER